MEWLYPILILVLCVACSQGEDIVFVSNRSHILKFTKGTGQVDVLYGQAGRIIVGLQVDLGDRLMFWTDISEKYHGIYRADIDGSNDTVLTTDVGEPLGLSLDWISNHIYWTDTKKKTIEIANYDGSGRKVLVSTGLKQPGAIVVAPLFGYLLWSDQLARRMERSWLDGSHRRVILKSKKFRPIQLAVSHTMRKLYWVDTTSGGLYSCDLGGDKIQKQRDLKKITNGVTSYGLAVIGNTAVISTWFSTSIYSMLVETRSSSSWTQEVKNLGTRELFSLVSLDPSTQPMRFHPCSDSDICSHLCLPSHGQGYRCSCPTYGGLALTQDGKTCQVPQDLLLYTLKETGEIGFISLDLETQEEVSLVSKSTEPASITYDPTNQVVYWYDITERKIYRAGLDGNKREIFLSGGQGLGVVEALAFNYLTGDLYFTNVGQSMASTAGSVFRWHRVEMINVNTRERRSLLSGVTKPVGIALDVPHGYMFVSDGGVPPQVIRMELDGRSPVTLIDRGLSNPGGMTVSEGVLYVVDPNQDNQTLAPGVLMFNTTSGVQLGAWMRDLMLPVSVAVNNKTLYYTDFVAVSTSDGYLKSVAMEEDGGAVAMVTKGKPFGVYASPASWIREGDITCSDKGCSHGCIQLPWQQAVKYRCTCPDEISLMLSSDQKTCKRPGNFLLFADMNTIQMLNLDSDSDSLPTVLHYGDARNNIVALVYDDVMNRMYWSDHTSNTVYLSSLVNVSPVNVYQETGYIDGIVMDTARQRLYWTVVSSRNGTGHISKLNVQRGLDTYERILINLNNPRAIALHPNKKWLYWTEHRDGSNGAEIHCAKVNGHKYRLLISTGLIWPNSLVVNDDQLYIADGSGTILVSDLEGTSLRELTEVSYSQSHVFGLALYQHMLFFTDWDTSSLNMVDMTTQALVPLVKNLMRPTSIAIHHQGNLTDHICYHDNGNPCSDECVPLVRGLYHCSCPDDKTLGDDGVTCHNGESTTSSSQTEISPMVASTEVVMDGEVISTRGDNSLEVAGTTERSSTVDDVEEYVAEDYYPTEIDHDGIKLEPLPEAPLFENCPSRDLLYLPVTGMDATALLNLMITATDSKGRPLEVTSNYQLGKDGIYVPWNGEKEETHVIVLKAEDDFYQQTVCEFSVVLQVSPPAFENCPSGETIQLTMPSTEDEVVLPLKPAAYGSDSSQLELVSSYSLDEEGIHIPRLEDQDENRHAIVFMANDSFQQVAVCEFTVVVQVVPSFENCPSGEILHLAVPSAHSRAVLKMRFAAYDSKGRELPVKSNYDFDAEGIYIPWQGEEVESHHVIVMKANDSTQHQALCEFSVVLQDMEPPVFTYCPASITLQTTGASEAASWREPEVTDNVGIQGVNSSHVSGSLFPPGHNIVHYTAADRAGNQASCAFDVVVLQDQLCALPQIRHGGIVCNHGDGSEEECRVTCEQGFVVNPIRVFRRTFFCKHPDDIAALTRTMKTQKPCLRRLYPSQVTQQFHLLLHGPVDQHRDEVVAHLKGSLSNHLMSHESCVAGRCQLGEVTVPCASQNALCLQQKDDKSSFTVIFNVTLSNSTEQEGMVAMTTLEMIQMDLMKMAAMLHVQLGEHHFTAISDSVSTSNTCWSCPAGQITEDNGCIACPVGTFHNISSDVCQYCGKGMYQSVEGVTTCGHCSAGQVSPEGATTITDCKTIPSMDEMTLFLIVTACTFGVVFLCMAITLYLQFQRQQKRNQQAMSLQKKPRYMTPNVYVAPPPILKSKLLDENSTLGPRSYSIDKKHPLNFYANHDYEDVDSSQVTTPMTVYQNDLFASSPSSGLKLLPPDDSSPDDQQQTMSRDNTFSKYSPQFAVRKGMAPNLVSASPSQPRKMSKESTFSNHSPRMMRAQRTPSSDGPLISQSPLLRLKLAAYNFSHDDQ